MKEQGASLLKGCFGHLFEDIVALAIFVLTILVFDVGEIGTPRWAMAFAAWLLLLAYGLCRLLKPKLAEPKAPR